MPHYKCATCKIPPSRLRAPAELVGDLCPECGSLLEPAAGVAELIGYRTVEPQDHQADPIRSGSHQQIRQITSMIFVARRAARLRPRTRLPRSPELARSTRRDVAAVALPLPGKNPA